MAQDNYDRERGIIRLNQDTQQPQGQLPDPQPDLQSIDSIDKIRNSLPQDGGVKPVSEMVADMFPGFGELASAINIGNDLKGGNYGAAALGLGMFAVPSVARKTGKYIRNPIRRFFNHTGHKIRGVWDKFRYGIQDRIDAFKYYNRYKNSPWRNKGSVTTMANGSWSLGEFPFSIESSSRGVRWNKNYKEHIAHGKDFKGEALLLHSHYLRPYERLFPHEVSEMFENLFPEAKRVSNGIFVHHPKRRKYLGDIDNETINERSFRTAFGNGSEVEPRAMEHFEQHVLPSLPHGSVFSADAQNIFLGQYMLNAKNGWNAFWRGVFGRPKVRGFNKKALDKLWGSSADTHAFYGSLGKPMNQDKLRSLMPQSAHPSWIHSETKPYLAYMYKHNPRTFKTVYTGKAGWFNGLSKTNTNVYKAQQAYREGLSLDEFRNLFGAEALKGRTPINGLYKIDSYELVDWLNRNFFKPARLRRARVDLHGNPYWYNPAGWRYFKGGKILNNYGK